MVNKDIPKPNFIIIGSAKCGTTTLADVLASHPDCCFSRPKEVAFFSHDENYFKGWEWYQQAFSHYQGEKLIGEATPNYTHMPSHPNCAERIKQLNPNTKIIYITRHPYKKLISEWKMHHYASKYMARKGFESYVKYRQQKHLVLDNCKFNSQLQTYREFFAEEQIKVFFLEDWAKNPNEEANKLCQFLGLDILKLPEFDKKGSNRSDRRFQKRAYFNYLRKSPFLAPIRKLVPSFISFKVGRLIGVKAISSPQPEISSSYKQEIINYFKDDAISFLKKYGKSESFWDFETI
ncbi:MAG: sulfotransferase domain-containing protein [Xenococcaceae cyanobacterium]